MANSTVASSAFFGSYLSYSVANWLPASLYTQYGPPMLEFTLVRATFFAAFAGILPSLYWVVCGSTMQKATKLPRVGKDPKVTGLIAAREDFLKNGHSLIQEGYDKYGDAAFVVQTADMERTVLSRRYVHELRSLPEAQLSLRDAMSDRHLGQYTGLNIIKLSHLQNTVCRNQLQQNLGMLVAGMLEEIRFELDSVFGQDVSNDFKFVNVYKLILGCAGRAATRSLVGAKLARDPTWLDCAIGYTGDVFAVSQDLRNRNWLVRPFVFALSASRKRLWARVRTARHYLIPLLKEREQHSDKETPEDLLKWMTASATGADKAPYRLSDKILFLCLASIHTSTSTAVHTLLDLCALQNDVLEELAAEIRETTSQYGGLSLPALNKMKKLDSFLKESQRLNHPGTLAFNRRVVQPITLSDGIVLQAGTFISIPTAMIARDPRLYDKPETFDPWRFAKMRDSGASEANKHQFASTSADSLPFGLGKFACPGRFFAAALIKQMMASLIMEFDFKFPDGQADRPKNVFIDERIAPDVRQTMGFRRKATADSWA